jgi:hypothetical protein
VVVTYWGVGLEKDYETLYRQAGTDGRRHAGGVRLHCLHANIFTPIIFVKGCKRTVTAAVVFFGRNVWWLITVCFGFGAVSSSAARNEYYD